MPLESFFSLDTILLFYAMIGGVLPALFWLWFWMREDMLNPEPRSIIFWCFMAGIASTIIAAMLEAAVASYLSGVSMIIAWSYIEESIKLFCAYCLALRRREFDEPTDALIYMITVALGFAALENTLFIIKAVTANGTVAGLFIGNMRFVGASLVHIISSSAIGGMIALSFYKTRRIKIEAVTVGLILATALHALFNFFIIQESGNYLWPLLSVVWVLTLILLLFFERVKKITN